MATNQEPQSGETEEHTESAELMRTDDYSEYLLHSKTEIIYLLRALKEQGDRVTVFFNEGKDFLLTEIVDVSDKELFLDVGSNRLMNQRAQETDRLFCVTRHDKVRIQFLLHGLAQTQVGAHPAFRAALPESVLRLQRREFFRLTTPIARPLKCLIPKPQAGERPLVLEATILDISGGGLAFTLPEGEPVPNTADEYADCQIDLPEVGTIVTRLQVRNMFDVLLKNGTRHRRIGCKFIDLPPQMLNLVQRYIIKMERERKARDSGMA